MKKLITFLSTAAASLLAVTSAHAAVDLSTEVAAISTDIITNIGLVGAALISAAAAVIVYKWVKAMIFG
ncbi:MAG: hypothetical protein NPINA01_33510 [Nitrospinaceae bacterium]|nr:MAG: hypothetical protein NPINA01_33510 [Nitrospinaceae bacterium]